MARCARKHAATLTLCLSCAKISHPFSCKSHGRLPPVEQNEFRRYRHSSAEHKSENVCGVFSIICRKENDRCYYRRRFDPFCYRTSFGKPADFPGTRLDQRLLGTSAGSGPASLV